MSDTSLGLFFYTLLKSSPFFVVALPFSTLPTLSLTPSGGSEKHRSVATSKRKRTLTNYDVPGLPSVYKKQNKTKSRQEVIFLLGPPLI